MIHYSGWDLCSDFLELASWIEPAAAAAAGDSLSLLLLSIRTIYRSIGTLVSNYEYD